MYDKPQRKKTNENKEHTKRQANGQHRSTTETHPETPKSHPRDTQETPERHHGDTSETPQSHTRGNIPLVLHTFVHPRRSLEPKAEACQTLHTQ